MNVLKAPGSHYKAPAQYTFNKLAPYFIVEVNVIMRVVNIA